MAQIPRASVHTYVTGADVEVNKGYDMGLKPHAQPGYVAEEPEEETVEVPEKAPAKKAPTKKAAAKKDGDSKPSDNK